ncbi:5-carboxymethyl-2-hydroxymuconate isomerase [Porticoccus sp. GXU_MW_L64]
MAHFIVEYSANLDPEQLDLQGLFEKLHQTVLDTGLFPVAGIRSRAHRCEHFRIADGSSHFGFVHLEFKLGSGRSNEEKQQTGEQLLKTLKEHLQPLYESMGLAISFEMSELPAIKYNHNNLREYLAKP